jgi:hypothetical protein
LEEAFQAATAASTMVVAFVTWPRVTICTCSVTASRVTASVAT